MASKLTAKQKRSLFKSTRRNIRRLRKVWGPRSGANLTSNRYGGLPKTIKIQSRYTEFTSLSPTAGLMASYVYSANGIYDPNITGGGHQTMYFDQLMALYDHYVVIGSKVTVRFVNTNASIAVIAGVRLTDSATLVTAPTQLLENARNVQRIIGPRGSMNTATVTAKVNPGQFLRGTKKGIMIQKKLQGSISTNPDEQCYWQIFATAADGSSTGGTVEAVVSMEYQIVFCEPKANVIQS